ncbi:zinc finger CCCH domain-containing protein 15 homolog [Spodoptera frugiperda]|uniref:Zinc finger CCCH domain-containing protein 15 n=2 Tax=Spodoptera frugiperda TaxID=7108 RepID=A0A9R0D943_SPOFR|nr:zinc finger CCCH domain-containing protein 15 homolog [Spodoptera frugiperda]
MPPKKASGGGGGGPSKKTEAKKKDKVIEDKTFGLKNKKGAKQQKFIQQVEKQVKSGGIHPAKPMDDKKKEKEAKMKEQKELAMLFKPVQTQKVEKGTDPKSVVCAFFKQGQCTKGDKCKFSHDLTLERKAEKRSLYVDMRDDDDNMDNWDEDKLKEVVEKKHGEDKQRPTTDIICKHFLEAVEKSKYGWFWECPSGTKCIYRHALPPGFVLKRDKKKMEEKKNEISLVDLIERERAALGPNQTKITLETFLAWKKKKIKDKHDAQTKAEEQRRSDFKAGRAVGLSGREMFSFDPALAADADEDDDEAVDLATYGDEEADTTEYREVQFDLIAMEASEADDTGTKATEDRLQQLGQGLANGTAADGDGSQPSNDGSNADAASAVPINENLFLDEDLDEELQNLDLED